MDDVPMLRALAAAVLELEAAREAQAAVGRMPLDLRAEGRAAFRRYDEAFDAARVRVYKAEAAYRAAVAELKAGA